jgi:hypothetical protein
MRKLILCLLLCAGLVCAHAPALAAAGSAIIQRRQIVIVRRGALARQFPERRRAVINYPMVSGIADRAVLRKVRALLDIEKVFETSLAEYRQDSWLTESDYKVNYNKRDILDITFWQEGVAAYPDTNTKHFAVSLRTGEVIKAADAFEAGSLQRLAAMANEKLRAEIAARVAELDRDKETGAEEKESFKEDLRTLTFGVENLDEFEVGERGVTFLYDAGFPHVIQALQPDGRYFFSYEQLAPYIKRGGPLGVFVK